MNRSLCTMAVFCLSVVLSDAAPAEEQVLATHAAREELLEAFIAGRRQLMEEEMSERERLRGAKAEAREKAMHALREKNRGKREALQVEAQALAESQPRTARPFIEEVVLPPNATPEMEAFLVRRAELQNDRIELENGLLDATPEAREQ